MVANNWDGIGFTKRANECYRSRGDSGSSTKTERTIDVQTKRPTGPRGKER